jgi:hypothetical protein
MWYININSGTSKKGGNPRKSASYLISLSPAELNPKICKRRSEKTSSNQHNLTKFRINY